MDEEKQVGESQPATSAKGGGLLPWATPVQSGDRLQIDGLELHLQPPDRVPAEVNFQDWDTTLDHALAALQDLDGMAPLHICFVGPTGSGKTERARLVARELRLPSFTLQGHPMLTPEDVVLGGVLTSMAGAPRYIASPLLSAFLQRDGGVAIFDEIGKAARSAEDALAPLSSALDMRRTIYSSLVQRTFDLNPGALFVSTAQTDEILPEYITGRMIVIHVTHPPAEILLQIVRAKCPQAPDALADAFRDWISTRPEVSPRKGILTLHMATRFLRRLSSPRPSARQLMECVRMAAEHV
jgi:MoxR-like ATPase